MRRLAPLFAFVLTLAGIALAAHASATDPTVTAVATGVYSASSYDGITVGWTGDTDSGGGTPPLSGYVYRTTGGGRAFVGKVQGGTFNGGVVTDTAVAVGALQTYVVVMAYDPSDPPVLGPDSAPVSGSRTSGPTATVGTIDVVSADSDQTAGPYVGDVAGTATVPEYPPSNPGELRLLGKVELQIQKNDRLPFTPGTYTVGDSASDQVTAKMYGGLSSNCGDADGSLTFTEADVRSSGVADVLTGSYTFAGCGGSGGLKITGVIRLNSTHGWAQGAPGSSVVTAPATTVGQTKTVSVSISNLGSDALTFGASPSITAGPFQEAHPEDWSVTSNGCAGTSLTGSTTCTISVAFHPSGSYARFAVLQVPDSSDLGRTAVELDGQGQSVPGTPNQIAGSPTQRSIVLTWSSYGDGNSPITGYNVYSADAAGSPTFLAKVSGPSFTEPAPSPGTVLRFRISAVNDAGASPLSPVYAMTVPHRELVFAAYVSPTGPGKIQRESTDLANPQLAVADGTSDDDAPAVSPDGTQLAYSGTIPGVNGQAQIWVARLDGSNRHAITTGAFDENPSWSPDGKTVAFDRTPAGSSSALPQIYVVSATGGTPRAIGTGGAIHPSWTQDGTHVVATSVALSGNTVILHTINVPIDGSAATTLVGGDGLADVAVSPDGTKIAASNGHAIVTIPLAGGAVTTVAGLSGIADDPAWTPDGSTIYFDYDPSPAGNTYAQIWSVPAAGGPAQVASNHNHDEIEPSVLQDDLLAPASHITGPSPIGHAASVAFTLSDADTPIGQLTATCSLDGGAAAPCTSPLALSGLANGVHQLTVATIDPHGLHSSSTASFTVHAAPFVQLTAPTAKVLTTPKAHIAWKGSGPHGPLVYDVRVQTLKGTTYGAPKQLIKGTKKTSLDVALAAGTQCISVQSRDKTGTASGWTVPRCIAVPVRGKSVNVPSSGVHFTHVAIVVQRCSGCGPIVVSIGGKKIGTISTGGHGVSAVRLKLPLGRFGHLTATATGTHKATIVGIALLA